MAGVALVIPMLNEVAALPPFLRALAALSPPPDEIVAVDGGSIDGSFERMQAAGITVLRPHLRGRAGQLNAAIAGLRAPVICVLPADTLLPPDAVAVMEAAMRDRQTVLAGFTALLAGPGRVRWGTSFHNWIKTWYAPLLFRPAMFARGLRLLFSDHAMFFRRGDFLAVGGYDPALSVMEDADLCIRLHRRGRIRLLRRTVRTSDRRVAAWGELRANWIYFSVSLRWAWGARDGLDRHYPPIR